MKNKFSRAPKLSVQLNLKKVLRYSVVVSSLLSGVDYTGITVSGIIGDPTAVFAVNSLGYTLEGLVSLDHAKV